MLLFALFLLISSASVLGQMFDLSAVVDLNFQCLRPIPAPQLGLSFVPAVFALLGGERASLLALSMLISYLLWILGSSMQFPRFGERLMYINRLV